MMKSCGRLCLGKETIPHPDRVQGLVELRQPLTAGKLMLFVHAVNWLFPALPELAKLEAPLRAMLEGCLQGRKRIRRAADRRRFSACEWTEEREGDWDRVRERVAQVISLVHRSKGLPSSGVHRYQRYALGKCVTQMPMTKFVEGVAVAAMHHELFGFVSGGFRHAHVK